MKTAPSIFNDVLGPVMRGPSSSHSAASLRIGRIGRDLAGGKLTGVTVDYDPSGSLVTTHTSQGSDLGLFGGLMGWATDDARLPDFRDEIQRAGIAVEIRYIEYGAEHPNTYRMTLRNGPEEHRLVAISTGGGMIEVHEIDGIPVEMTGDFFETLAFIDDDAESLAESLAEDESLEDVKVRCGGGKSMIQIKSRRHPSAGFLAALEADTRVTQVRMIGPVLPVLGRKNLSVPFLTCDGMLAFRERDGGGLALWELALRYESERAGISPDEVLAKMDALVSVFENSISTGLGGTTFADRILPCQSGKFGGMMGGPILIPGDAMNRVILYVTAMMEMKSSMGVIVAAPTAGSCGALPGAVFGVCDALGKGRPERVQAMLVAGLIGVFITARSTFAAEVAGCMAECGSGSAMAAAALVGITGGTLEQQLGAASQALQNSFGMTCDTLANRVEAPCLGKNVMAATNAMACANMALADYRHLVPLDQVIDSMREVGEMMPRELRCTGLGGLAITPASRELERLLAAGQCGDAAPTKKSRSPEKVAAV